MSRTNFTSGSSFEESISYSRAVVTDGWVMVSGTTGQVTMITFASHAPLYDYSTGEISPDVAVQADQAMANAAKALTAAGASIGDVVRVTYILPDRDDFPKTWPALNRWLGDVRPAATMMQAPLMKEEMKFEVEITARIGCASANAVQNAVQI